MFRRAHPYLEILLRRFGVAHRPDDIAEFVQRFLQFGLDQHGLLRGDHLLAAADQDRVIERLPQPPQR